MILKTDHIAQSLAKPTNPNDPLVIRPTPDLEELRKSGAAAVDLRLGCWFLTCRSNRLAMQDVYADKSKAPTESQLTKSHFVPFGESFILHPQAFVLGVTFEWIRLPSNMAGYVVGRSSWGRHGLIIATATGVHPGFTGCLTLEITNVGAIPIKIMPGTAICQLFFHSVESSHEKVVDRSRFVGMRKPSLGVIELDQIARKLVRSIP